MVSAGADQTMALPNSGTLNGTVTFGNATAVDTTASFSEEGAYVLRLTANDGSLTTFDDAASHQVLPAWESEPIKLDSCLLCDS